MGPRGLGPKTVKLLKSLEIMKSNVFFQHGKDAHQHFEKGALNDSSRSLIWGFLKQLVFYKIGEKASKVSKIVQVCIQLQHLGEK